MKYLFRNMDLARLPRISASQFDGDTRELELSLGYKTNSTVDSGVSMLSSETQSSLNAVVLDFAVNGKKHQSYIVLNSTGVVAEQHIPEAYFEKISTVILPSDISASNPVGDLGEIIKLQRKPSVIALLQKFDSRINALEVINGNVFLGMDGMAELIPIAMAGDGMKRYLNIIAAAANPRTNIILVDEIDNGLHYSAYKKLWEALFALAVETNKQIFVTTHSKEALQRLNQTLEGPPDYQNEMRLYTIENTLKKGFLAYKYTYEGLSGACENDIELRSVAL